MKLKMSSAGYWLVAFVLILAAACGGGGGGGGTSTNGNGGGNGGSGGNFSLGTQFGLQGFFIEFQDGGGTPVDPVNLRVGSTVKLQGVFWNKSGQKTNLNNAITLSGSTGGATLDASRNLRSSNATGFFQANMTVVVNGVNEVITQQVRFTNSTVVVQGTVNTFKSKAPKYLQIDIFDPNGNKVGAGTVAGNGSFRATVTTTSANRFTINSASIDNFNNSNIATDTDHRMYRVVRYQSANYPAGDISCTPFLPALSASGATLPAIVYIPEVSSGPPPVPDGCLNN